MRKIRLTLALLLSMTLLLCGCESNYGGDVRSDPKKVMSKEDAVTEISSLIKKVNVSEVTDPVMDIYTDASEMSALADIDTFAITVQGTGQINLEIAAPSEISGKTPDDWLNVVAEEFNRSGYTVNGKSVYITVRKIASGEVVTYIAEGGYRPQLYIPSNYALGKMLEGYSIETIQLHEGILRNTAGLLMENSVYETYKAAPGEPTMKGILEAAASGEVAFAYTNPYTSATGLNMLTAMLAAFDANDPLSSEAVAKLNEYQKTAPPVAYTTGVLRNSAKKGLVNCMVMEEQGYINTPELRSYVYIPAGIRHDHPVYTFSWCTDEEIEAAKKFVEFCMTDKNQQLGKEKGFGLHDDYINQDPGLTGTGYISAQKVWKENKTGGDPVAAVFIADISGSMNGTPLQSLKDSLIAASPYISSDSYVGLVSYSSSVTINLPLAQFDDKQRAYFTGEVKNLKAGGNTATYDAVIVAMNMLNQLLETTPNARPIIFVLTDGEQNSGYSLSRITDPVGGMRVPIYSIAYNYNDNGDLEKLSNINEAAVIKAGSDDVVNQLRNLFNVNM